MPEMVGVDIGRESVTIAVVARSKKRQSIRELTTYEYDKGADDLAARAAFAAEKVSQGGYGRMPVAVSLPGTAVFLRPLSVPFSKPGQIAKTLLFELDGKLPFDVESAVVDFVVTSSGDKSSRLLVAAMPREALLEVSEPFLAHGLNLSSVTADVLSAPSVAAITGEGHFTILEINASEWKMSICAEGRLVFARAAAAAPASEKMETSLGTWFKQSLMAAGAGVETGRVFAAGGLAKSLDLQALGESAGAEIEALAVEDGALEEAVADRKDEIFRTGTGAISAGLALAQGRGEFDLYGAAHGRESAVDKLFGPLAAGVLIVTLILGVTCWGYWKEMSAQQARLTELTAAEAGVWQQTTGEEAPQGGVYAAFKARLIELEQGANERAMGGRAAPILKALYVISKTAPAGGTIECRKFEAAPGGISISASARDEATVEKLVKDIVAEGTFTAESRGLRKAEDRVEFELIMSPKRGGDVR